MTTQNIKAHQSIELRDLSCPHLLTAAIQSIQSIEPGQVIQIKARDLNAPSSIAPWFRQSGNELLDMYKENGCFFFLLKRDYQEVVPIMEQQKVENLSTEG